MPDDCNNYITDSMACALACLGAVEAEGYTEDVVVRTRTWTGGAPGALGATYVDVDATLDPRPWVGPTLVKYQATQSGKTPDGTRRVKHVSRTYAEEDLTNVGLATNVERYYLVGGNPYQLVTELRANLTGWTFELRRMMGKRSEGSTPTPPTNTVAPAVYGVPETGQTLACLPGTWGGSGPLVYTYQWQRDAVNVTGATSQTVVATPAGTWRCVVTVRGATSPAGTATTAGVVVADP